MVKEVIASCWFCVVWKMCGRESCVEVEHNLNLGTERSMMYDGKCRVSCDNAESGLIKVSLSHNSPTRFFSLVQASPLIARPHFSHFSACERTSQSDTRFTWFCNLHRRGYNTSTFLPSVATCYLPIMSLVFRRGIASMASLKKASKVVCIGRNYAYVYIPLSSPTAQIFFCGLLTSPIAETTLPS